MSTEDPDAFQAALNEAIELVLSRDPDARYATPADLSRAIAFFLQPPFNEGRGSACAVPSAMEPAGPSPPRTAAWLRSLVTLCLIGCAAFMGLALTTARRADIASAARPFAEILAPRAR